jgi:hypothetical protein
MHFPNYSNFARSSRSQTIYVALSVYELSKKKKKGKKKNDQKRNKRYKKC